MLRTLRAGPGLRSARTRPNLGPLCVDWLRRCGGVLEHPAHSRLFSYCGLPLPGDSTGILWTIEVLQTWWGSLRTQKRTWLCFAHIPPSEVQFPITLRNRGGDKKLWQGLSKSARSRTNPAMAEWLVNAARKANPPDGRRNGALTL